jgi:ubiquinone/menaquinone biosynthesis C-methylase UbiE
MIQDDLIGLRRMWNGFQSSRVIITAVNYGIFDRLEKPKSAARISTEIKADRRATEILLNALTALGLLKKQGNSYRNNPLSSKYLVKGKPLYQGDIVKHAGNMWQRWSHLDKAIATGKPVRSEGEFDHEAFIMGMHNLTVLRAKDVLRAIGLKGIKSVVDVGGGPGTYCIELVKKGIKATLFDYPETLKIARKVARKAGAKGIKHIAGDFHVDGIGKGYDLAIVSQIFHSYTEDDNISLLRKCHTALNPGGRVAVHEFPLNEDRTGPPHSALFSINMLLGSEGGRSYTPGEMSRWLKSAGFTGTRVKHLKETVLVMGKKR